MAQTQFEIIEVPLNARDKFEAMGTKPKFWFNHPQLCRCLYKQGRPGTGEDWAEKVASELAELLHLPHAHVELATWNNTRGTASPSFILRGQQLVHGKELLVELVSDYPNQQGGTRAFYHVKQHTLDVVLQALNVVLVDSTPPGDVKTGSDMFVGYLLLDALIGNTDRHHENWGIVAEFRRGGGADSVLLNIAPTYDHASSLGRELTDEERSERLATRDRNRTVAAYVDKARSALYNAKEDAKPMTTLEAFCAAASRCPAAAQAWLRELERVTIDDFGSVLGLVPVRLLTAPAKSFALAVLTRNRERLLSVLECST